MEGVNDTLSETKDTANCFIRRLADISVARPELVREKLRLEHLVLQLYADAQDLSDEMAKSNSTKVTKKQRKRLEKMEVHDTGDIGDQIKAFQKAAA